MAPGDASQRAPSPQPVRRCRFAPDRSRRAVGAGVRLGMLGEFQLGVLSQ